MVHSWEHGRPSLPALGRDHQGSEWRDCSDGVSGFGFVTRGTLEVGGGLGCMQVSPSLMVLCISMGHSFLLGGRQTSGVWLRGPQCGLLGGQASWMKACEPNPGLGLRPRVMAGPNCQILGRLPRGQSRGHAWPPFRGHLRLSYTWCLEGFLASFGPRPYGTLGRADAVPPERPHCRRLVCLGIRPILMSFLINAAFNWAEY